MINDLNKSKRTAAVWFGIAYLLTFIIVVTNNYVIHEPLNVPGNAAATAKKIVENEYLFRGGIVLDLLYAGGFVILISSLYTILKEVNQRIVVFSVLFQLVFIVSWVVLTLKFYDALRLMKTPEYLNSYTNDNLFSLSKLMLNARFDRYYGVLLFYSGGAILINYLWLRSKYIPRALALWGIIAAAWCTFCAIAYLVYPSYELIINPWLFDLPMAFFDITLSIWLLTKGLKFTRSADA